MVKRDTKLDAVTFLVENEELKLGRKDSKLLAGKLLGKHFIFFYFCW